MLLISQKQQQQHHHQQQQQEEEKSEILLSCYNAASLRKFFMLDLFWSKSQRYKLDRVHYRCPDPEAVFQVLCFFKPK